ncbi:MAG: hypothetical protein WC791_04550 [Candidatus Paceibacterota bacterium]|jgi:hypothetical protein
MKQKYWLQDVLLNFQSADAEKQHAGWVQIRELTGRQYSSFESTTEAISCAFVMSDEVQSMKELKKLIRTAKKAGLSLDTMDSLIYLASQAKIIEALAGTFAKAFLKDWTTRHERGVLAYDLFSCLGMSNENISVYKAVLLLQNRGWIPDVFAVEVCGVLMETCPRKWFITFCQMAPMMNRLEGRIARTHKEHDLRAWRIAEKGLLERIKALQVIYPQVDKGT